MAEIPIQRKERRRIWPVLLILLLAALLVAWYVSTHRAGSTGTAGADSTATMSPTGAAATDSAAARGPRTPADSGATRRP
jgi:hypothetical protein